MKDRNKTPYLVLFIGIVSILTVFISTFGRAYAFYTSFYTTPGFNIIGREPYAMFDVGSNVRKKMYNLAGSAYGANINAIERSTHLPSSATTNLVSSSDSQIPIIMWYNSSNKTILYYSQADTLFLNPDSSQMIGCNSFGDCSGIRNLKTINMAGWNTSRVTNMYSMFEYASNIDFNSTSQAQITNWNTMKVVNMSHLFNNTGLSMTALNLSNWNTSNVTDFSYMFQKSDLHGISGLHTWNTSKVQNMSFMFAYTGQLTSFDFANWDVRNVKNMSGMFSGIQNLGLTHLNLHNWNTHNVTDMSLMFYNVKGVYNIDMSSWNTTNVQSMRSMFYGMERLNQIGATTGTIYLSNWDVRNVTTMSYMFANTTSASLKNYNLQNWNTYKVQDMSHMFEHTRANNYYTTNWVMNNVTNTTNMFYYTNNMVHLNMYNWNLASLSSYGNMFTTSYMKNFFSPVNVKTGVNIPVPYTYKYGSNTLTNINSSTKKSVLYSR